MPCRVVPCRVVWEPGGPSCPVVCVRWRHVQVAGLNDKGRQQRLIKEQSVQILANHLTNANETYIYDTICIQIHDIP